MLNYTGTDQHGHRVVGTVDDQTRTRREVALQLYGLGYRHAAIHDEHALVAGIDTHRNGDRYWWASLKPAARRSPAVSSHRALRTSTPSPHQYADT